MENKTSREYPRPPSEKLREYYRVLIKYYDLMYLKQIAHDTKSQQRKENRKT